MSNRCAICGANLDLVGRIHRCIPKAEMASGGEADRAPVVELPRRAAEHGKGKPVAAHSEVPRAVERAGGELAAPTPSSETKPSDAVRRRRGRPKVTGQRPWEVEGISRRTWYRDRERQAEQRAKE